MQYSPKLKQAAAEVEAIMKKYDIAGAAVFYTPGYCEYLYKIDASFSCAKITGPELRVRAKLDEDFGGDKRSWLQKVKHTVEMFDGFAQVMSLLQRNTMNALLMLRKHVDIDSNPGEHSSHTQQNN